MNYQAKVAALWQEVSSNKLFKWQNFWQDLWLLSKYDLRLIDKTQLQLNFDTELLPDCQKCSQNCCHGAENTVSLRLIDIARLLDAGLEEAINLDNQSFKKDAYFKEHRNDFRHLNSDSWNLFPVLRRVNNICPYLDTKKRCTIYEHRPLTCRRFPYVIAENKKNLLFSKKCHQTKKEGNQESTAQKILLNSAVDSYNEKIKDLILIYYAREELQKIDLAKWLNV